MFTINFYVPFDACEKVKKAMFDAGAGQMGKYDSCAWQIAGKGQFRPLEGSNPIIGVCDNVEYVDEFKVEMVCTEEKITPVIAALIDAHPYEEPAYHYFLVNPSSSNA